ncbi:hypothetical protein JRO89_XS08G0135500 [Xanthoceras sorbifolium]|uniref:Uncharacterized protein n=1 Tax=Xanthoceras sorbifolium TaxID=99658 RepID=A0ABQ8HPR7_9ROSI|nr:hypothetical protein JRO89_XS08G0135500 [Xanthoceras sorbifolium]
MVIHGIRCLEAATIADDDVVLTGDVEKDLESSNTKETNNINSRRSFVSAELRSPRSVKIALGAKLKLGFIDESYKVPNKDLPLYDQWTRVNCMITLWILNSISKDIVEAFLYASTARELWYWFKQLKDQKKKESRGRGETAGRFAANFTDTPLAIDEGQNAEFVNLIQQELLKMMKRKSPIANMVNFAHLDEYAGKTLIPEFHYALSTVNILGSSTWIVDTGASIHVCANISLLTKPKAMNQRTPVFLPDGSVNHVKHTGNVNLRPAE